MNNGRKFWEGKIKKLDGTIHNATKGIRCPNPKCVMFFPGIVRLIKCNTCSWPNKVEMERIAKSKMEANHEIHD